MVKHQLMGLTTKRVETLSTATSSRAVARVSRLTADSNPGYKLPARAERTTDTADVALV